MRLFYNNKKIVTAAVCIIIAAGSILFLNGRTAMKTEDMVEEAADSIAYAVYEEPAMATIVPNDLLVTTMGNYTEPEYETSSYLNKVVAYVDEFLPVRTEPDWESETIGKMYPGCVAEVIERGEVWSKIRSGNVEGYIQNMYVCFDEEAEDLAILLGGEEELVYAVTIEEEEAMLAEAAQKKAAEEAAKAAAEKAEAEARAAAEAVQTQTEETLQADAGTQADTAAAAEVSPYYMELSEEDIYLIACIIDWEANSEVYEGKLAVANIILNRVRSSAYPDTVSGVIYQRGQFGGVLDTSGNLTSRWQTRLANGPRNEECIQAAREAAAGNNNVIGYLCFNGTAYCNLSSYKSYVIIGNHCFYQR